MPPTTVLVPEDGGMIGLGLGHHASTHTDESSSLWWLLWSSFSMLESEFNVSDNT